MAVSGLALAVERIADPENYRALIKKLLPGDVLIMRPGVYRDGLQVHGLNGTPQQAVVIMGDAALPPPVFLARADANTVSIVDSSHVVVRNLELDGRGLAVDAVKAEGHGKWAHHITLENLRIVGHGNGQQTVGISTKCPAWNWVIRGNVIVGAGTGIYLGNSDGRSPFVAGLIEHNLIVDTLGYNLQIKHQLPRPELPGMPRGKSATVIRHNVFSKQSGGAREHAARPNVLLGHWPRSGPGEDDEYQVYGNYFFENPTEALLQGEGNLKIHNNVFVNHGGDALRIQPHKHVPKRVTVAYNTLLARGVGIAVAKGEGSEAHEQVVSHNAVFAGQPLAGIEAGANVVGPIEQADRFLARPDFAARAPDLRPKSGALRLDVPFRGASALPELQFDFDGAPRDPRVAGAYTEGAEPLRRAPGWKAVP